MAISSSALLPRVGSWKSISVWSLPSGALENLKVVGTHCATHFTPVCSLLPMLLNSMLLSLALALQGTHTFIYVCVVLQFVSPSFCANKKDNRGNCWRSPAHLKWTVYSFVMSPQTVSNLLVCRRSRWPCSLQDRFSAGHAFCSISGELSVRSAWLGHQCH